MASTSGRSAPGAARLPRRFRKLQAHLEPNEQLLESQPAIWTWQHPQEGSGVACDVIVTTLRLLGYYHLRFPRERLFLEAIPLAEISAVALRKRSGEPLFQELQISQGERQLRIRAPGRRIEALYAALESAVRSARLDPAAELPAALHPLRRPPAFERQALRGDFERSAVGIALLFAVGLLLEIGAAALWVAGVGLAISLPPFCAGLIAVLTALLLYREAGQRRDRAR
jgi:hypothetical protein